MRVLWVGDAVVSTGFARCTHAACDALHAAGHDVHVIGINYRGGECPYPYPVYQPRYEADGGVDGIGVGRLPPLLSRLRPDVVVLLNDPWNIPLYFRALSEYGLRDLPPVVGWVAVDSKNQRGAELNDLAHAAVWTQFAADELAEGGYCGPSTVIPLGVDHAVFAPADRDAARRAIFSEGEPLDRARDAFIVGVVGRNQIRKRLDLSIAYFAEWVRRCRVEDALLYLHVAPTGEAGCDVPDLLRYHGVLDRAILGRPSVSSGGVDSATLAQVYAAMDVYLTTSQGEGFGLPALEAMACGRPCVLPGSAAFGPGGWVTAGAAVVVPCSGSALTAPTNAMPYTVGAVMDRAAAIEALDGLYRSAEYRRAVVYQGAKLAAGLSWERAGREVSELLERVVAERRAAAPVVVAGAADQAAPAAAAWQGETPAQAAIARHGQPYATYGGDSRGPDAEVGVAPPPEALFEFEGAPV